MKCSLLHNIQNLFQRTNFRGSSRRRGRGSVAAEMLEPRQLMTVYSIDPVNGSDSNPGTLELPYRTPIHLSYGTQTLNHRTLQAGDVVYLRDGLHDWSSLLTHPQEYDYHAAFLIRGVHGTEAAPIIVQAFPGERPIVQAHENGVENSAIYVLQSENVKVLGLEVTGTFGPGIQIAETTNVEIAHNYIHDVDGLQINNIAGIYAGSAIGLHIHHNLLHDNYDRGKVNNGLASANNRNIVIFGLGSDQVKVDHNKVFNTPRPDGREIGAGIWVKHASTNPNASFVFSDNIVRVVHFSAIGSQGINAYMHHNLIVNGAPFVSVGGDNVTVIRGHQLEYNTFVETPAFAVNGADGLFPSAGLLKFQHNIVTQNEPRYHNENGIIQLMTYGPDADYLVAVTPRNLIFDQNVYFNPQTPPIWNVFSANGGRYGSLGSNVDLAGWQTLGMDANSVVADPQFNASFIPANPVAANAGWLAGDQPRLTLYVAQDVFRESSGANASSVTIVRSSMSLSQPLTVTLTTNDATEIQLPGTVTFPAGVSVLQVPITAVDDNRNEPTRAVQIFAATNTNLRSSEWVRVLQDSGTTLPPPPPPVERDGVKYSYFEGDWSRLPNFEQLTPAERGTTSTFTLAPMNRDYQFGFRFESTIVIPVAGDYTFYLGSDDGSRLKIGNTVVVDNDGLHAYAERQGTIRLEAGRHSITVEFFESGGRELLTVDYSGPGLERQSIPSRVLIQPIPAVGPGSVEFDTSSQTVNENDGTVTLTLIRHDGSAGAVNVKYATRGGTATSNSDFTAKSGRVQFADGETSKTITVALRNDTRTEADEDFTVSLSRISGGATLGATSTATVIIRDDEPRAPRVSDVKRLTTSAGDEGLLVQFDGPMNENSVTKRSAYVLREAGRDGLVGTSDNRSLSLKRVIYDSLTNTATLTFSRPIALGSSVRLKVLSFTIFGATRLALDGNEDGLPGGNYERDA